MSEGWSIEVYNSPAGTSYNVRDEQGTLVCNTSKFHHALLLQSTPDLLEALRDLRAEHHCSACDSPHAPECPSATWADRAIAKAEGR